MEATAEVTNLNQLGSPSAAPPPLSSPPPSSSPNKWKISRNYGFWLLGLAFSFFPVLVVPVINLLKNGTIYQSVCFLVKNTSIMYIGVSLLVSALNDIKEDDNLRTVLYMLLLVGAVFFYTLIEVLVYTNGGEGINQTLVIFLNIFFFVVPLVCGLCQYSPKSKTGGAK